MENQHKKITGYRDLSQAEIDLMNEIKAAGNQFEGLIARMRAQGDPTENTVLDHRWISIAQTHFQQGLMALTRAVARPTSF